MLVVRAVRLRTRWRGRPQLSGYRIFAAVVFVGVVAFDAWFDGTPFGDVVGPLGVLIWVLTLIGHFGIGPMRLIWNAVSQ